MHTHTHPVSRSLLLTAALAHLPLTALAECLPVDTLPAVLVDPGEYCLVADMSFADARGTAITIAADGVTLDLQGFELRGPHFGGAVTIPASRAVFADDAGKVTIRNGRISGFGVGVSLGSSLPLKSGNLVEDLHIDGNASVGIGVGTAGTIIRNNRVTGLDGSLQGGTSSGTVIGIRGENIWGIGFGNQIVDNAITGFKGRRGTQGSSGIRLQRSSDTLVEGNYIQSTSPSELSWGIWISHSHNVTVLSNRLHRIAYGIDYANIAANTSGKYGNNITERVTFPYRGVGTDIGNNF